MDDADSDSDESDSDDTDEETPVKKVISSNILVL